MTGIFTGIENTRNINITRKSEETTHLHLQLGYEYFVGTADFGLGGRSVQPVEDAFQIGISVSRPDRPFRIWFMEFDRLGLTYSIGEDGKFRAVTLATKSWFRK